MASILAAATRLPFVLLKACAMAARSSSALRSTNGNRVAAARMLAISRATLYEKLAKYPELASA